MLISLGGVTGGLCARSCVNGATRNSTRAAQICRMVHNLTSQHALNDDFVRISPNFSAKDGGNLPWKPHLWQVSATGFPPMKRSRTQGFPCTGAAHKALYPRSCGFRRKRLLGLARKCYMQIIAHCYPVFAFFSGPTRIVGPLILAVTTTRLTEPEAASLAGGSTSGSGLNCRPQGLTRPCGLP